MIAISLVFACRHDIQQTEVNQPSGAILSVKEAQQWFEGQPIQTIALKSGKVGKLCELKIDWTNGRESENNNWGVVDINILSKGRFWFINSKGKEAMERTGNEKYLNSLSRLIVQKNKKNGRKEGFVMTMVASPEYMEKNNFDLTNNTYLKRQKDYTGLVLLHTISGEFVNGWNYAQGKIIGKCSQVAGNNSLPLVLKKADCVMITVTLYNQFCTDWYTCGIYTHTTCEERTVEDEFYYLSCAFEPYDPGETGSSGIGGNDGGYDPPCS